MATPNLGLALLDVAQSQKETTINSDWNILDGIVTRKTGDTLSGAITINVGPVTSALNLTLSDTGGGSDLDTLRPDMAYLKHYTSATTVPGVGMGVGYRVKDAAGTELTIGRLVAEITTPSAGVVDSTQAFTVRKGGTEVEVFRLRGSQGMAVNQPAGSSIAAGNVGGQFWCRGDGLFSGANALTPSAFTTGSPGPMLTATAAVDTGLTASTEANSVLLDFSATRQWATGSLTNQRACLIKGPTYSFVGASTITNAATVHIAGQPIAGTNATITNNAALWVQGQVCFGALITGTSLAGFTFAQTQQPTQPTSLYIAPQIGGTMTASTEAIDVYLKLARTQPFATGALATQRNVVIEGPTYSFVGASTVTDSATLAITAAPAAGSNATLTSAYALWVQAGGARIQGHLNLAGGNAPTAAAGSNNGTTPPAPVVTAGANDTRGNCTFGSGTGPAAGNQLVVSFNNLPQAYTTAPTVMVVPKNSATAALNLYVTAVSTSGFTVASVNAPGISQPNTTYSVDFWVVG